jgi:hypothetical protein
MIAEGAKKLETPGLVRQVETHLIFGPLSRHLPLGYIALACTVIVLVAAFVTPHQSRVDFIMITAEMLMFLVFIVFFVLRMTLRQQAILGFIAVKLTQGIGAFMMITIGSAVSFQRHQSDAWPNLFLGLIWLPSIEFLPRVTPHQKYVTIARTLLSIPFIYLGVSSGYWHWN